MKRLLKISTATTAITLALFGVATAQETVKIGVLTDMSSMYASTSGQGSVEAVRMAAETFGNEINGMPIEIISADMQNKADIGSSLARRWLDTEEVDAIIDIPNSAVALAVQEIIRTRPEKLLLVTSAGTSDLTNAACAPNSIQWTFDTYSQAAGLTAALVRRGLDKWFYLTVDYAFGQAMERDSLAVQPSQDNVVGKVNFPFNAPDFASYLLSARQSGAQVVAFSTGGSDTINSIKQASEFGLAERNIKYAVFSLTEGNVTAIGLDAAQGAMTVTPFYWNRNAETIAFSEQFKSRYGSYPSYVQAGTYSAALNYFAAVEATGNTDALDVVAQLKSAPINDIFATNGTVRDDGLMVHDMYLVAVKSPGESSSPDDVFQLEDTIAGADAYRPLEQSSCSLINP